MLISTDSGLSHTHPLEGVTLAQAIADRVRHIDAHAAWLRNRVTAGVHPAEMASWPLKVAEAEGFNPLGAPPYLLSAEAAARGIEVAELVGRVLRNAGQMAMLEAAIAGTAGRHRDTVAALETVAGVLSYDFTVGWPS